MAKSHVVVSKPIVGVPSTSVTLGGQSAVASAMSATIKASSARTPAGVAPTATPGAVVASTMPARVTGVQAAAGAGLTTAVGGAVGAPTPYFITNFVATENPLSESGAWIEGKATGIKWNNVQTNGTRAYATAFNNLSVAADDSIAQIASLASLTHMQIQGAVYKAAGYSPPNNAEIELFARQQITPNNARGYEFNWQANNSYSQFVRWNGPISDFTYIGDAVMPSVPVDGDVVRLTMSGATLTVYLNGTQRGQVTDNTFTSGAPGIGFWADGSGGVVFASYGWKYIIAAPLTGYQIALTGSSANVAAAVAAAAAGDTILVPPA